MSEYRILCPTTACQRCGRSSEPLSARRNQFLCVACKFKTPYTGHEITSRERKVAAAASLLIDMGVTPEEFGRMTDLSWNAVLAHGVRERYNMPSVKDFSVEARVAVAQAMNDALRSEASNVA